MYMEWSEYMALPCCAEEKEPEEIICPSCVGEGKFYYSIPKGKYIDGKEYKKMDIISKIDIEVEDCLDCIGKGVLYL